jgi:hypothetical protein
MNPLSNNKDIQVPYDHMEGSYFDLPDIDDEVVHIMDDMMTNYVDYPNLLTEENFSVTHFPTLNLDDGHLDRYGTTLSPSAFFVTPSEKCADDQR